MKFLHHELNLAAIFLIIILVFLSFSPPLAFIVSIFGLALIGFYKTNIDARPFFIIFIFGAFFSTLIAASSHPLFLYKESDFTTYYQNYLVFYKYGLTADFLDYFKFGSPIEIGLPIVNYIFSLVIDAPLPYMVKLFHAFLQLSLVVIIVFYISKKYSLQFREMSLLFALIFLFYKFGATLNHLAQGYSSLFIILAIFKKRYVNFWFFTAVFFHVSAIVVYPLIRFLVLTKNKRKLIIFNVLSLLGTLLIFNFLNVASDFVTSSGPLFGKLIWAFTKVMDSNKVFESIKAATIASIYLLPIMFLNTILILWKKLSLPLSLNILSMFIFILSFSYLPGISVRVMAPVLTILIGFLYFISMFYLVKFKQFVYIFIFFITFFPINWILKSELYYYNYPLASFKPLYYLDTYFISKTNVNRNTLPSREDIVIKNPYR